MGIQQLKQYKVLVIGDYCEDIFIYGNCNRLSPEAPVPIITYSYEHRSEGMAANVYNNLKALNISCDLLVDNKDTKKVRYVDLKSKHHLLRTDYESKSEEINIDINILKNYNAIIISDYDKGSITQKLYNNIRNNYSEMIFIDSKKNNLSIFNHNKNIIKINEQEFIKASKLPESSYLIVTKGDKGATFLGETYPTKPVEVVDVSGAGDTFLAALVVQYLLTNSLVDGVRFANICAANVVKKTGTAIVNFEEVKNDLCF